MEAHSMWVFISPNMAVVEIYNAFIGELGFVSEEDLSWKVRLINTTVQKLTHGTKSSGCIAYTLWG